MRWTVGSRTPLGRALALALGLSLVLVGCGSTGEATPTAHPTASVAPSSTDTVPANPDPGTSSAPAPGTVPANPDPGTSSAPAPGTVPPAWLGQRVLPRAASGYGEPRPTPKVLRNRRFTLPDALPMLPGTGFQAVVTDPAPASVIKRSSWTRQCPVAATELSWVRVTFRGFDGSRHTGELLVHASVDEKIVHVFRSLWQAAFPMEQLVITPEAEGSAPPTGDGNDTGAFNCRAAVGATAYSQHAYGLAVDVNPFQNPYTKADLVLPELASSYLDRSTVRPGMITPDGPVVQAFRAIGWSWGGAWKSLKDFQHFSQNGR